MTTTEDHLGAGVRGSVIPRDPAGLDEPSDRRSGRATPAARAASEPQHPRSALSRVAVMLGCYVVLAATLVGSGMAMTHLLSHGRVGHWDDHVNAWFAAHRSSGWNSVSADFTLLANTLGVIVAAGVVTTVLLIRRWGKLALLLIVGLAVELAVFLSTTYLVARPRPGVPHLGSTPSTFSWPSGHTAATVVVYGGGALLVMIATSRRWPRVVAWLIAVALIAAVALSRIYRGEHHPTDTVAGVVLGIGALWAAVLTLRDRPGMRSLPESRSVRS